jgi:polysaccharide export outer membrane protein
MDAQPVCHAQREQGGATLESGTVGSRTRAIPATRRDSLRTGLALRGLVTLGTVAVLASCTSTSNMPPAPPVPGPSVGYVPNLTPYKIQVGDILDVRLMLNPELNEEVAVRPDGYISTTVVPEELAYGRTVGELSAALRHDYSKDLHNPRLTVELKSFAPVRIYVGGEVTNPGEYINVGPTLTLSQAIARAGGHKPTGDTHEVFIIRRGPNDVPEYLSTRYNSVIGGTDATGDVRLAPYDVVYVPKTGVAEVFTWFNQYFQQFVPVSWGFSYLVNNNTGGTSVVSAPTH